jgi:hypothetical protein
MKEPLLKQAAQLAVDETYVGKVTLEIIMNEYSNICKSLQPT